MCGRRNSKIHDSNFQEILKQYDVILLIETWTSESSEYGIDGYTSYCAHRTLKKKKAKRDSGGLIVYVRDSIAQGIECILRENDEMLWLKLDKQFFGLNQDALICLCYAVPSNSTRQDMIEMDVFDKLQMRIAEFESEENNNYLIVGDFNARTSVNADYVEDDTDSAYIPLPDDYVTDGVLLRSSEDAGVNVTQYGRKLLDLCIATGLRIVNGRLGSDQGVGKYTCITHRGSSVVDYVLSMLEFFDSIKEFRVEDHTPFSDHNMITWQLEVNYDNNDMVEDFGLDAYECHKARTLSWESTKAHMYTDALKTDIVTEKLDSIMNTLNMCDEHGSVDNVVTEFTDVLLQVADPVFGKNRCTSQCKHAFSSNRLPMWMCDECKIVRDVFYEHLNVYRLNRTEENRLLMVRSRNNYAKHTRKCRLQYDRSQTAKLLEARTNNAREYWRLLRGKTKKDKSNVSNDEFYRFFKNVNSPTDEFYTPDEDVVNYVNQFELGEIQVMVDELDVELNIDEIRKAIKQLKHNKSPGMDQLINEYFIHGVSELSPYLLKLFNKLLDLGIFPSQWSNGLVVPLHKKGSIHEAENYRGITLLSVLGKLFTRILNNRLTNWAETYGVYVEAQGGFRKGLGTTDSIYVLHNLITWCINHKRKLYCAFVDYSKAFDYVVRENLWYKLLLSGVSGKMMRVIMDMYKTVSSCVKGGQGVTNSFDCILGVRQGESLSPFLFAIYVNDLEKTMRDEGVEGLTVDNLKLFVLFYADDAVVLASSRSGLQEGIDCLSRYCQRWKLTLNITKTKVVVFRAGGRLSHLDKWTYNGTLLEIVSCFTYLGVLFSYTSSFSKTQQALARQGRKALFCMRKIVSQFNGLSPIVLCDLFDKLILPILSYGCEVWGFYPSDAIERIEILCVQF